MSYHTRHHRGIQSAVRFKEVLLWQNITPRQSRAHQEAAVYHYQGREPVREIRQIQAQWLPGSRDMPRN